FSRVSQIGQAGLSAHRSGSPGWLEVHIDTFAASKGSIAIWPGLVDTDLHGRLTGVDTVYSYSMAVVVVPMRKRGVPINPQKREAGEYVGDLRMHAYNDPMLHRMVTCVDLTEPGAHSYRKPTMLPSLLDVKLISLANDALVITGFERLEVAGGRQA